MTIYENIYEEFKNGNLENKTAKQIFGFYDVKTAFDKNAIRSVLERLEKDGKIIYLNGKFVLFENAGFMKGTLKGNERGFAFFIPDDKTLNDFFIPNKSLNGAMHGDKVYAQKCIGTRGSSDEAEVVKIIERGIKKLVGTYMPERNFAFVRPDDKNYFCDIYVSLSDSLNAKKGDKVYVEILRYEKGMRPEGRVTEVLGKRFDISTEELSVVRNLSIPYEFTKDVLRETDKIPDKVSQEDIIGREDFRDVYTITIDGDDSRDFDDAISIKKNGDKFTLGVHIADVSHYVKEGSNIDKEAFERGNSVYFPDSVIPMLPEKLSNGICSLNEGVDRLTLSCVMEIDSSGNVVDKRIAKSVINSNRRMTYKKVQAILDGDEKVKSEYSDVVPLVLNAKELRDILNAKRKARGSVNLDVKDAHITINGCGEIDIEPSREEVSYSIIEEFMLAANETVAEYIFYLDLPFVYRIHEKPSADKLRSFASFLALLGIRVKWNEETCHPRDFQVLLDQLNGTPYFGLVNKVMLRSMQKAKYSETDVGHFGLSAKHYCHFTSPIRRYADLTVHRVLKSVLDGTACSLYDGKEEKMRTIAEQTSLTEKKADEAERDIDDFFIAKYMKKFIGYEAEGIISGVTGFGVFVELENTVEGLIKLEDLPRGEYSFDEKTYTLKSKKHSFSLGEKVHIVVLRSDLATRRVEFGYLGKEVVS